MPLLVDLAQYESVSSAARRLQVSTAYLYRLLDTGRLDGLDSPAGRLVLKASVDRYDAERRAA